MSKKVALVKFPRGSFDQEYSYFTDIQDLKENGVDYPGFKVVEGRSNRKWTDEKKIGEILIEQGFLENIIYTKKLTGITNMESAIGKKEVQSKNTFKRW